MLSFWKGLVSIGIGALTLGSVGVAQAQCPWPDGLDGGQCCTTANRRIPRLPSFAMNSFDICWRDCDVDNFFTCRAEWTRFPVLPVGPFGVGQNDCGPSKMVLTLRDLVTNSVKYRGIMRLTYSRTWLETDATGVDRQVWRFIANGDLRNGSSAGQSPCPTPPCAASFNNRVRYTGYVDWARSCDTGAFENAWMLSHQCDVLDHAPNFPRAGFFHPNRAYTLVGPAANFAIGPIQPVAEGGASQEAVRRLRLPPPGVNGPTLCEFEELVDSGLDLLQELCICGSPNGPFQYAISDLGLGSSCGTSIFTPGGPFLPGYLSMGIGSWTSTTTYPGLEILRWSSGGYDYFDPCAGVTRQEVFFGVTTIGGFAPSTVNSFGIPFPLGREFVDQVNSLDNMNATIMNVPFARSSHVLNLNYD